LLCANTNIIAIEILKGIYEDKNRGHKLLDMRALCKNPIALPLIEQIYKENPNLIEYDELAGNSAAYDLLMEVKDAVPPTNFHWGNFSANSKIGTLFTDKYADENQLGAEEYFMLYDWEKLNWDKVSSNRSTYVLEYLFNNVPHSLINIGCLSGNPNPIAIKFLKKRIKFEKRLSAEELGRLQYREKIDWELLSGNYAALRLLIANKDKIFWPSLSLNESAISLIKERIIIEENLIKESNERLKQRDEKIADLKQQIENLKITVRNNEDRLYNEDRLLYEEELLEFEKILIKNQIDELKEKINKLEEKIDSEPPIEKNFLFEPNILNWPSICTNSKAIKLLEDTYKKTPDKIFLNYLLENPSIFVLNHGDPSYPTELPIRFSSSSGNKPSGAEPFSQSPKPRAQSLPVQKASSMKSPPKPRAQSLPVKKASSMKSPSPTKKTSVNMAISPPP